jgi:death-on-curing protein
VKEPAWLDAAEILAIHERLLALHGGAGGIRDQGLLHAALAKPRHRRAYDDAADIARLATGYTAGIIRAHPFVDGNKRTGFVAAVLFVELNGYHFVASEEDAAEIVLAFAAGTLDEEEFAGWLSANLRRR